jgi:threonylcarbamoyladenosine tRNA methylthiotransferase MtaB
MKTYTISTLGCKVNQAESECIGQKLAQSGLQPAEPDSAADVCIINTCTVTGKAAMQSRQAVRKAIRRHPSARIIITGCYADIEPEALLAIEGIGDIVGHSEKEKIPEMLLQDKRQAPPRESAALAAAAGRDALAGQTAGAAPGICRTGGRGGPAGFCRLQWSHEEPITAVYQNTGWLQFALQLLHCAARTGAQLQQIAGLGAARSANGGRGRLS